MENWYQLDRQGRIIEVSPHFDSFSRENGGPPTLSRTVLGRPLLDFVSGQPARTVIQMLLKKAEQKIVRVPMRCDCPRELRLMEMTITPDFLVSFLTIEKGPRRSSGPEPEGRLISLCSWCNTFQTAQGWLPLEQAANLLQLLVNPPEDISHGMCPTCVEAFESEHFDHLGQGFQAPGSGREFS
ncbi:MAG: hypothetical protein U0931_25475 [Vulcanimicrobiota bacterium]